MRDDRKPLVWLHGEIKTPPISAAARIEAGLLLARLQHGETLAMPQSRPMPGISPRCHELRVKDARAEWRIMYRADADAVLLLGVFAKKTRTTPRDVMDQCRKRIKLYDEISKG